MVSSKSSSMIDLPSSMIPAMPSQCLPRTFSSRLANDLFQTCDLALRLLEVGLERRPQLRVRRGFRQLRQGLRQLLFASYVSRNSSMNASWSVPASAMSSLLVMVMCRRAVHHTRGGSVSLAKCRCFAMAAMKSSVAVLASDVVITPGSGLPSGSAVSMPQAVSSCSPAPSARIGLQWRYWSLMNSSVRPSARSASRSPPRRREEPGRRRARLAPPPG